MIFAFKRRCACLIVSTLTCGALLSPSGVYAANSININAVLQSDVITNKFNTLNSWHYNSDWGSLASSQPDSYVTSNYPFIKYVRLFTATGGCYTGYSGCSGGNDRDLFVNPADTATMTDYKFDSLKASIRNVLDKGLKPYIVTGNVPVKYSAAPYIGAFNVNTRPPTDYSTYYDYIKAMADALVSQFGVAEIKTWKWGVLSEFENADWFWDGPGSTPDANASKTAYFKLYDYTVAALQSSIGAGNLTVGAHAMAVTPGLWDPRDFIDHVATGTNYKTGGTGTQINFITASYYDNAPGVYTANSLPFVINRLRDRAIMNGLTNLQVGVDEGWFLTDTSGKDLFSRSSGTGYQGAYMAKKIKEMVDYNIDWFSVWALNAYGVWGGASVPTISTNVIALASRMAGERRAGLSIGGSASGSGNVVDGFASYSDSTKKLHVLVYNYNSDPGAASSESLTIAINNIAAVSGGSVNVKSWTVDDTHANFWPRWWSDKGSSLTSADYGGFWSPRSVEVPAALTNSAALAYWNSRLGIYQSLAALASSATSPVTVSGNSITLSPTLNPHGVMLYEITNVTSIGNLVSVTDDINDFSKMNAHSSGLFFDSLNVAALGDTRRAARTTAGTTPEFVTYQYNNSQSVTLTGLFDSTTEPINNFKLYASSTGASGSWALQSSFTASDTPINSNLWTKRVYNWSSLPAGTNYVKVEFPTGGSQNWNPQLSQVTIQYAP